MVTLVSPCIHSYVYELDISYILQPHPSSIYQNQWRGIVIVIV